ncbi:hypothetical protein [Streptomyces diastatochromogenes]|uniref:hypothetical protein n=1 Tax=Streptomyces diastatochromogenes TaxID=42236 RepID=UPI0036B29287
MTSKGALADWPPPPYGAEARGVAECVEMTAVPYFVWANREAGAMRVWLPPAGHE